MDSEIQVGLLPKHREKRGRGRGREAGVEQRLNGDYLGRRIGPGDRAGVGVGEEASEFSPQCIIAVKSLRFSTVYGKEVGSGIVGLQRFGELFEDGTEAGFGCQQRLGYHGNRTNWARHFESIRTTGGPYSRGFSWVSSLVVIMGR